MAIINHGYNCNLYNHVYRQLQYWHYPGSKVLDAIDAELIMWRQIMPANPHTLMLNMQQSLTQAVGNKPFMSGVITSHGDSAQHTTVQAVPSE
jgi:hypothetical protein